MVFIGETEGGGVTTVPDVVTGIDVRGGGSAVEELFGGSGTTVVFGVDVRRGDEVGTSDDVGGGTVGAPVGASVAWHKG